MRVNEENIKSSSVPKQESGTACLDSSHEEQTQNGTTAMLLYSRICQYIITSEANVELALISCLMLADC